MQSQPRKAQFALKAPLAISWGEGVGVGGRFDLQHKQSVLQRLLLSKHVHPQQIVQGQENIADHAASPAHVSVKIKTADNQSGL